MNERNIWRISLFSLWRKYQIFLKFSRPNVLLASQERNPWSPAHSNSCSHLNHLGWFLDTSSPPIWPTCVYFVTGSAASLFVSPLQTALELYSLGLGLDGAFVLLGAWRATDDENKSDVPKRMERTYENAAVAITITTMTDVLTFMIGATIPHVAVRLFCLYMSMTRFFESESH